MIVQQIFSTVGIVLALFAWSPVAYAQFPTGNGVDILYRTNIVAGQDERQCRQLPVFRMHSRLSIGMHYWFQLTGTWDQQYYTDILEEDPAALIGDVSVMGTVPLPILQNKYIVRLHAGPVWSTRPFELVEESFSLRKVRLARSHLRTMIEVEHYRWFVLRASRDWVQTYEYGRQNELYGIFKLIPTSKRNGSFHMGIILGLIHYRPTSRHFGSYRTVPQAGLTIQL